MNIAICLLTIVGGLKNEKYNYQIPRVQCALLDLTSSGTLKAEYLKPKDV